MYLYFLGFKPVSDLTNFDGAALEFGDKQMLLWFVVGLNSCCRVQTLFILSLLEES